VSIHAATSGRRNVRCVRLYCAAAGAAALVAMSFGIGAGAAAASAVAVAAGGRVNACDLLSSAQAKVLLGGPSAGTPLVTGSKNSASMCAWTSTVTGADAQLLISKVSAGTGLKRQSKTSIAGYLDCQASKLVVVKSSGEFGYFCGRPKSPGSPANMDIQDGSVLLHIQGSAQTTGADCAGDAKTIFRELHVR
jgi:hypothetical protein